MKKNKYKYNIDTRILKLRSKLATYNIRYFLTTSPEDYFLNLYYSDNTQVNQLLDKTFEPLRKYL